MLSNAYFLAKFRFDTAENEPAKNLQNLAKFANFADPNPAGSKPSWEPREVPGLAQPHGDRLRVWHRPARTAGCRAGFGGSC